MKLVVENLTVKLQSREILRDVTFKVESGEVVSLLGPNGSGKSTMLRTIFGILKPIKGVVLYDGKALNSISEASKVFGYLPQENPEIGLKVLDVVLLGRTPYLSGIKRAKKKDIEIALKALEDVGLKGFENRKFNELSGGEKQKVMIARVFAQEPKVMLLDEPTAHLDISAQIEILEIVRRKVRDGCSALIAMHDINLASSFSDKILMIKNGKIVYAGTPDEVISEETIRDVYDAEVIVKRHGSRVYVIPKRKTSENGVRVHIICGGGSGRDLIYMLSDRGYKISAGVLNVLDSDWETVVEVGGEVVSEAPFTEISDESHAKNLEMIEKADFVVLTNLSIGKGNLKNLYAAKYASKLRKLIVIEKTSFKSRNFVGVEAEKIYDEVVRGSIVVGSEKDAIRILDRERHANN